MPSFGDQRLPQRFWKRVEIDAETGCWRWTGATNGIGYGVLAAGKRDPIAPAKGHQVYAHRAAYHALIGPIPDGKVIDHLCRSRSCVNPGHLEPVTMAENTRRGISVLVRQAKYRAQTHCKRGHPLFGKNLHINSQGARVCRQCSALAQRRHRSKENNNDQ